MSENQLLEYVVRKYRNNPLDTEEEIIYAPKIEFGEILHRTDLDFVDCDADTPFSHVVSNWEYERHLNESKRIIKILHPSVIDQVTSEIYDIFTAYNEKQ